MFNRTYGATEISPISKEKMDQTEQAQNPEVADQAVENHKKSPAESFAELRRQKEEFERKVWELQKEKELMQRHLQMQAQQGQPAAQPEEDFDFRQLEQEEFPDGKKLVKAFTTVSKKLSAYEQKLLEKDQKIQALETISELEDFKSIVTPENIEKYIKADEDNAEAVSKAQNPLRKAYNLIKKSAAYQADLALKKSLNKPKSQEQVLVEEKEFKPKTGSASVRSEAVTIAAQVSNSKLTREQKNALWAETNKYARRWLFV